MTTVKEAADELGWTTQKLHQFWKKNGQYGYTKTNGRVDVNVEDLMTAIEMAEQIKEEGLTEPHASGGRKKKVDVLNARLPQTFQQEPYIIVWNTEHRVCSFATGVLNSIEEGLVSTLVDYGGTIEQEPGSLLEDIAHKTVMFVHPHRILELLALQMKAVSSENPKAEDLIGPLIALAGQFKDLEADWKVKHPEANKDWVRIPNPDYVDPDEEVLDENEEMD